jgi:hypothetical protein
MRIEIAGKGLPEHIGKYCKGRNVDCPGGPRGWRRPVSRSEDWN